MAEPEVAVDLPRPAGADPGQRHRARACDWCVRDVGRQYDTSDIPVREALRMLERDGLVETVPYAGARVTSLSAKEVEETYFIRSHLESIATGLAAQRITDEELAELDVLMAKMDDAVAAQDGPAFSDLNQTFHRTIVGCCGNDMLRDLTMDIWQRHSGFQRVFRKVLEGSRPRSGSTGGSSPRCGVMTSRRPRGWRCSTSCPCATT